MHSLAWRMSLLLDPFKSVQLFSFTDLFPILTLSYWMLFFACGENASSNWIIPFLKVDNLMMHFSKVSVAFTALELWQILKDCEKKIIAISASRKCSVNAKAVQKIELKFILYRVFLPPCISYTIHRNLYLISVLLYRTYTFMNRS